MARPALSNPLEYVLRRQYTDHCNTHKALLNERLNVAKNLYRKDLLAHYGCVNAIEFSNKGSLLASGGDDRRVLIWNVEHAIQGKGRPQSMDTQHHSNIFCLGFDSFNSKVFSAGNDDQVITHDIETGKACEFFQHQQPVYGLSIDPLNDHVFASACDDGQILLYDIREPASSAPFCLASYLTPFHAVMYNPVEPRLLTTANSREGVGLWDIRRPRQIMMHYGGVNPSQSCMSVRFNEQGTNILALRRRLPPVLYSIESSNYVCQFDHPGYYNSCTMKSCCFAGENDKYILSGSDDFNLYMWKIPELNKKGQWISTAHMVLHGHRSIVNQVRFNSTNYIIASSGVEKLIKFWSPFHLPDSNGSLNMEFVVKEKERKVYTHDEYISLVLRSGQFMSHDYSHQSTKEDPRMMAFFDSLVQREIEGWSSEDSDSSASTSLSAFRDAVQDEVSDLTDPESTHSDSQVSNLSLVPYLQSDSQNRISQLIAKKRNQLIRLARSRAQLESARIRLANDLNIPLSCSSDTNSSDNEETEDNIESHSSLSRTSIPFRKRRQFLRKPEKQIHLRRNGRCNSLPVTVERTSSLKSFLSNSYRRSNFVVCSSSDDDSDSHLSPSNKMRVTYGKEQTEGNSSGAHSLENGHCSFLPLQQTNNKIPSGEEEVNGMKLAKGRKRVLCYCSSDDTDEDENPVDVNPKPSFLGRNLNGMADNESNVNAVSVKDFRKHCFKKRILYTDSSEDNESNVENKKLPKSENEVPLMLNKVVASSSSVENNCQNSTCNDFKLTDIEDARYRRYFDRYSVPNNGVTPSCSSDISDSSLTPNFKQFTRSSQNSETPDSGIGIPSCSSSEGNINSISQEENGQSRELFLSDNQMQRENDSYCKGFKKYHINRVRRNYRNHIGDSDSN